MSNTATIFVKRSGFGGQKISNEELMRRLDLLSNDLVATLESFNSVIAKKPDTSELLPTVFKKK